MGVKAVIFSLPKTSIESSIQVVPAYQSRSFLQAYYIDKGLSARAVAALTFSARSTIIEHLRANNIPLRSADKQRLLHPGQIRYGEKILNGRIAPHKDELKVIERMKVLRTEGHSYRAIAKILEKNGIPTKNKKLRWHATSIMKILKATSKKDSE